MNTQSKKEVVIIKRILQSKDFKISVFFSFIGMVASIFVAMYQLTMLSETMEQEIIAQVGSTRLLIPIAATQGVLMTFVASFIGLKLAKKVNLHLNFKYDKKSMKQAILIGFLTALIITLSDRFVFASYLPTEETSYAFSPIYFITGVLYGGIVEEILLRLFMMSLLVLILWKLFARTKNHLNIPNTVYISSIILAAILFALGHLPATVQIIGISLPILIRMFVLNGIGGLGYGYLYWKHGLAYSMVAHGITHVFMQAMLMPILF